MKRTLLLLTITVGVFVGLFLFLTVLDPRPVVALPEDVTAVSPLVVPIERSDPARTGHDNRGPVAGVPQSAAAPTAFTHPRSPTAVGAWDSDRISHPRVISDTGQYRLWYGGNGPSGWATGMASSPDNLNWTKSEANPFLGPGPAGSWDDAFRGQISVLKDGGLYKMWYSGAADGGYWQTGYATSTNGTDWNIYGSNPVLSVGPNGSWDEQEADGPVVIKDGGTYKMWYHGCDVGYTICSIGYATSTNGIDWNKYPGNPVLTPTVGQWDENFVGWPAVVKNGSTYEMWYYTNGQIGRATSSDGLNWTKYANNPVIAQAWDGQAAGVPSVLLENGTYRLWLSNSNSSPDQGIGYMESTDGISWTMPISNPILRRGTSLWLTVNYAHEWVAGHTNPGAAAVVTLTDSAQTVKATATVIADSNGDFFTNCSDWSTNPNCPNIQNGDGVAVSALGLTVTIDEIGNITGDLDADTNTVSGILHAPWFTGTLNVRCEVWVEMGPPGIDTTADANGGAFTCDFDDVGWDLEPGQDVAVMYWEPDGDQIINVLSFPWARANYAHDWVGINYAAGHTFWITLTDTIDNIKATAVISSWSGGGWGADGFDTQSWHWSPAQPDIQPGDKVTFLSDDGYYNQVEIGVINGNLNVAADTITGTINAAWFTETLTVECHPWGAPFPVDSKQSAAAPDGSTPWNCSWAGEWDIVPGQDVATMYLEPDYDRIIDVYRDPVPHLRVNKWADGAPTESGNFVFHVEYWNDGDAPAENVIITDTMQGFGYLFDTNSYAVTTGTMSGGEYVVWDLGTLPTHSYNRFELFVRVTALTSDTVTNTVEIITSNPYDEGDPGEKFSLWVGHVEDNDTHLNVGKWAWTGDPAPGYDLVFAVNVCNNGSTASSQVVVTDTLHPSMTLQTWWGQNPGWSELSSSSQELVVAYPAMPGFWCNEIYLQVNLDTNAWPGMYITNTAVITAANDLEGDDNFVLWEGNVNEPHANLQLDKNFNWGVLAPGGQVAYGLNVGNSGNIPIAATFYVTDYLPISTTYNSAWHHDQYGPHPVTPTVVTAEYVVWEINGLANGFWENWEVILDIDSFATPGTVLTNTAVVSPQPDEDSYTDNVDTWLEKVNPPGPNLRLRKSGQWNGQGQLNYWLQIENIGTVRVYSPTVTDTLPVSTTFNNQWWHNFWQGMTFTDDSGNGQLVWTLDWLDPGWNPGVGFNLDVDGPIIGQGGLFFTNTATVDAPGLLSNGSDVNPADNTDTIVMSTGPDITIQKWANTDVAAPGDIITFTVQFGNSNPWPWDTGPETTITDTLPPGMTFITATAPWDPNQPWMPTILPGNVLVWDWGHAWNNSFWQFEIVVEVAETVTAGQVLINEIEMYSDDPADVEPDYSNNVAAAPLTILAPAFTISKDYESTGIAGRPVTYTLTFSNTGNLVGTGIVITDHLPANVTWVSGGSYNPSTGIIAWDVSTLNAGQAAAVSFVGTLGCSGSAINDDYRVASSNEGVSSPIGLSVAFTIQAPTIVASFLQSATTVEPGETIIFTSTSTTNGTPFASWVWDFGDNSTGSGQIASHTYATPGTYDVELTVTDACGYSDTLVVPNAVVVEQPQFLIYLPVIRKP